MRPTSQQVFLVKFPIERQSQIAQRRGRRGPVQLTDVACAILKAGRTAAAPRQSCPPSSIPMNVSDCSAQQIEQCDTHTASADSFLLR